VTVLSARRGAVPSRLDRLERLPSDFVISQQTSQFRVEPSCIINLLIRIKRELCPCRLQVVGTAAAGVIRS
jgi:hypothetical protein